MSHFGQKLAAAIGVEPPVAPVPGQQLCEVQRLYNDHKKYLSNKVIESPLPERIYLRDENFPYWIKLENPDPSRPVEWVGAKSSIVIPLLDAGIFDQTNYRIGPRAKALLNIPNLLRDPNCIHENGRHAKRGEGGIHGRFIYIAYEGKKRKVAFTTLNEETNEIRLVTSFMATRNWVLGCAKAPALYVRKGSQCNCCE